RGPRAARAWAGRSPLHPADRWVRAAAVVPGARGRARPHLAAPKAPGQLDRARARLVQVPLELLVAHAVAVHEPFPQLLAQPAAQDAARAAVLPPERHVDAAGRLEPHQLAHGEHVERHLEPPLLLPLRDGRRAAPALVVAHEEAA